MTKILTKQMACALPRGIPKYFGNTVDRKITQIIHVMCGMETQPLRLRIKHFVSHCPPERWPLSHKCTPVALAKVPVIQWDLRIERMGNAFTSIGDGFRMASWPLKVGLRGWPETSVRNWRWFQNDFLILEGGPERLTRNVGKELTMVSKWLLDPWRWT